jgi:hypothetical protein
MEIDNNIFIEPLKKYIKKAFPSEYNDQQMLLFGFTMEDFINPLVDRVLSIPIKIEYTNEPKVNPSGVFNSEKFEILIENINKSKYFKDKYNAGYSNYVNAVIFHEMVHAINYIKKLYTKVSYDALAMGKEYYHDPEEIRAYRAMMKDFLEEKLGIPKWQIKRMMSKYTTDSYYGRSQLIDEIYENKVASNMNWYKRSQKTKTIEEIAKNARNKVLKHWGDLRAVCLDVSRYLRNQLIKNGYKAIVVQGTFAVDEPNMEYCEDLDQDNEDDAKAIYNPLHYWVEVNGKILDLTADQFNDEIENELDKMPEIVFGEYAKNKRYKPLRKGWKQ